MIDDRIAAYLTEVDAALPGFVERLYVVGSAALGAWQPGVSDIDTVVFTSRRPAEDDLAALRSLPYLVEGPYLAPPDGHPMDRPVLPFVVDGELQTGKPCGELTPVVWLTLQRYGYPVRGPAVADLGIEVDPAALRAYLLDNLRTYWQASVAEFPAYAAGLDPAQASDIGDLGWVVLGPARLHYTLATGDIVSKAGAGEYIAAIFPEHRPLIERAIRARTDPAITFTADDLLPAYELTTRVVEDAVRRY